MLADRQLPSAGSFSDEELYDGELDRWVERRLRLVCPTCGHGCAPLTSKYTSCIDSGLQWVGLEYQEPFAIHKSFCSRCHHPYTFKLVTPQ